MEFKVIYGDIVDQDVDVLVNSWNRNILPWWLLILQGVSRSIKKRAGYGPFNELAKMKVLDLGEAVATSAGRLPHKAIIHVAGINLLWRGSRYSIETSVRNAIILAEKPGATSLAMPLIGAGSGGFNAEKSEEVISHTLQQIESPVTVCLVKYRR